MARRTRTTCDRCGSVVSDEKHLTAGGTLHLAYNDRRRTSRRADLCDSCIEALGLPVLPAFRYGERRAHSLGMPFVADRRTRGGDEADLPIPDGDLELAAQFGWVWVDDGEGQPADAVAEEVA